jgi:hypothetical protein
MAHNFHELERVRVKSGDFAGQTGVILKTRPFWDWAIVVWDDARQLTTVVKATELELIPDATQPEAAPSAAPEHSA